MNPESISYRHDLAEKLVQSEPKARPAILEEAKSSHNYWKTRGEKQQENQPEEEIDNGLAVFVRRKTLYHGSDTSHIEALNEAEETTLGSGVYLTSEAGSAIGYATHRSRNNSDAAPTLYEVVIERLPLLDLRKSENVEAIAQKYRGYIVERIREPEFKDRDSAWQNYLLYQLTQLNDVFERDEQKDILVAGKVKLFTQTGHRFFSNFIKTFGYAGLISLEGGEGGIGNHDTYLIFNPDDVHINKEQNIPI